MHAERGAIERGVAERLPEAIDEDLKNAEEEIMRLLREVTE